MPLRTMENRIAGCNSTTSDGAFAESASSTCDSRLIEQYKARIIALREHLHKIDEKLREMDEEELSLDDLGDDKSVFLNQSRLEKKGKEILDTIAKLEERCSLAVSEKYRIIPRNRINLNNFAACAWKIRYPQIARKVLTYIRKVKTDMPKSSQNSLVAPDYCRVLKIVQRCNEKDELRLSDSNIESLARDIHKDVTLACKRIRVSDFKEMHKSLEERFARNEAEPKLDDDVTREMDERLKKQCLQEIEMFASCDKEVNMHKVSDAVARVVSTSDAAGPSEVDDGQHSDSVDSYISSSSDIESCNENDNMQNGKAKYTRLQQNPNVVVPALNVADDDDMMLRDDSLEIIDDPLVDADDDDDFDDVAEISDDAEVIVSSGEEVNCDPIRHLQDVGILNGAVSNANQNAHSGYKSLKQCVDEHRNGKVIEVIEID